MDQKSKDSKTYLIENALVIVLIGSAIALQVIRIKKGSKRSPFLMKLVDLVAEEVVPWPFSTMS